MMTRTNGGRDALRRVRTVQRAFLVNADATKRIPPSVQLPNLGLPLRRQKEGKIRDKRVAFADNADIKAQYRGLDVIGYDALLL